MGSLLLKWEFVVTLCLCTCICVYVSTPREMSGPFMLPSPLSTAVVMCRLPFHLCVGWYVGGGLLFIFWLVWSKVDSGSNCRQASHRKAHQSIWWFRCLKEWFRGVAGLLHSSLCLSVKSVFPFILTVRREIGFILVTGDEDTHGAKRAASAFLVDNLGAFRLK